MSEVMIEKARELGRLLGQSAEYQALDRARKRVSDDRELVTLLNRLGELESALAQAIQRGQTPEQSDQEEYEKLFSELQGSPVYQGLVAAQSNFDKRLVLVNEEISKGMETASQSRIILPD